jgi:hypothetical protein
LPGSGLAVSSYGPWQVVAKWSVNEPTVKVPEPDSEVHGVKCPISNWVKMFASSAAHGTMLPAEAVEYSG